MKSLVICVLKSLWSSSVMPLVEGIRHLFPGTGSILIANDYLFWLQLPETFHVILDLLECLL